MAGILGPDGAPFAGAKLAPSALHSNTALCFDGAGRYAVVTVDAAGVTKELKVQSAGGGTSGEQIRIEIDQTASGKLWIRLNNSLVVDGLQLEAFNVGGAVAVHALSGASVQVTEMSVDLEADPLQHWFWLPPADGIAGQGSGLIGGWIPKTSEFFRSGAGFVSPGGNLTMSKWNFIGTACKLWLPKGPSYGTVRVSVDGVAPIMINLYTTVEVASAIVYEWNETQGSEHHRHSLLMRWNSGGMVADSIQFLPPNVY